ncbi:MAG: extracellular solute-binding protein [Clostridiaceae bacterium]|jgi:raffinose/stachyose/melibiose transport system substrate-binding protein|nr:extracellular solute-binding protein [Clostridiaceae bacterium]
MKKFLAILTILALMLGMAACGAAPAENSASPSAPQDPSQNPSSGEPTAEPVTLRMITWVQESNEQAIANLNAAFTAKYPNVTFVVDTVGANDYPTLLNSRITAGDVDILTYISAFDTYPQDFTRGVDKPAWETFILGGSYLDITDQPFIANWDPGMINNAVSYKGRVYGLDMGAVGYNGVFYNKTMFEEHGFEEPGTWAEFETICNTLKAKGITPITVGGKDQWPLTSVGVSGIVGACEKDFTAFAKGLWEGTRKLNDEQSMKIWNRFEQLVGWLEPNAMAISYGDAPGRLVAGKAAMMIDGTWNSSAIEALDPNFKYGYFPFPGDVDGNPNQLQGKYDMQFNIYAKSPNVEWALKYFEFLSQKENYGPFVSALGFFPTMPGVESTNAFVNSLADKNVAFMPSWEKNIVFPKGVGQYATGQLFNINHLKALGGSVENVKALADLAQQDWDAGLAAAK